MYEGNVSAGNHSFLKRLALSRTVRDGGDRQQKDASAGRVLRVGKYPMFRRDASLNLRLGLPESRVPAQTGYRTARG